METNGSAASELPVSRPRMNVDSQPFWDATAAERLRLQRCTACDTVVWSARAMCPGCGSFELSWFDAAGTGVIYSFSVARKGQRRWAAVAPYVVAYVELTEGPRIMTNIVGCAPDSLEVGAAVRVVWDHSTPDADEEKPAFALPRFTPV